MFCILKIRGSKSEPTKFYDDPILKHVQQNSTTIERRQYLTLTLALQAILWFLYQKQLRKILSGVKKCERLTKGIGEPIDNTYLDNRLTRDS
ncbi:unnamed protein product [Heterobilharzia americana]|nr:unnamed protein product [Heterobilharzia americana]